MGESRPRPRKRRARLAESHEAGFERELAESHENARRRQKRDLTQQVLAAIRELRRQRAIVRRRALDGRGQESAEEIEPVVRAHRLVLVREPDGVESPEEEVSGFVAGEDPPRAVASVRGGRETHDQQARGRIAEGGQRPAPVRFPPKPPRSAPGRFFAPRDEPRTPAAGHDPALETPKLCCRTGQRREYFPMSFVSARTWPRIAASRSCLVAPAGRSSFESSAESVNT